MTLLAYFLKKNRHLKCYIDSSSSAFSYRQVSEFVNSGVGRCLHISCPMRPYFLVILIDDSCIFDGRD